MQLSRFPCISYRLATLRPDAGHLGGVKPDRPGSCLCPQPTLSAPRVRSKYLKIFTEAPAGVLTQLFLGYKMDFPLCLCGATERTSQLVQT